MSYQLYQEPVYTRIIADIDPITIHSLIQIDRRFYAISRCDYFWKVWASSLRLPFKHAYCWRLIRHTNNNVAIQALLSSGIEFTYMNKVLFPAAIRRDNLIVVETLLDHGVIVGDWLADSVRYSKFDMVMLLLKYNPTHKEIFNAQLIAIYNDNADGIFSQLLNVQKMWCDQLLIRTLIKQAPQSLKLLLDNGARFEYDVNLICDLLATHSPGYSRDIIKVLWNAGYDDHAALIVAIKKQDLEMVLTLLELGADPHYNCDKPLRVACDYCCANIVEALLVHGADPDAENGQALLNACRCGRINNAKILINHGATYCKSLLKQLLRAARKSCSLDMVNFVLALPPPH